MSRRLGEYACILAASPARVVEETDHACRAMYAIHRRHALRDRAVDAARKASR